MPLRHERQIGTNFERLLQVAAATVAHVAQTCDRCDEDEGRNQMPRNSMLDQALTRLYEAAGHLDITADVLEKHKSPRETTQARLVIRMDDGSSKSYSAWRCRYDDTLGPTKRGIRFHQEVTIDEIETLRLPDDHEVRGYQSAAWWCQGRRAGGYSQSVHGRTGAPRASVYSKFRQGHRSEPGHPGAGRLYQFDHYGLDGRRIRLYRWRAEPGGDPRQAHRPRRLARTGGRDGTQKLGLRPGARVAIQGFGKAGKHIAQLLGADGFSIVAVTGLDVDKLIAAKRQGSVTSLAGSDGVCTLPADELVSVNCELLVLAALEDMVHARVKAHVILELANGPITLEADKILNAKNIVVLLTSWPMRAVSPFRISNGCRTGKAIPGPSSRCMRG